MELEELPEIRLQDGRVCSANPDNVVKLFSDILFCSYIDPPDDMRKRFKIFYDTSKVSRSGELWNVHDSRHYLIFAL